MSLRKSAAIIFINQITVNAKVFQQDGEEYVEEEHDSDDYQRHKEEDGCRAFYSGESEHDLVPVVREEHLEHDEKGVIKVVEVISRRESFPCFRYHLGLVIGELNLVAEELQADQGVYEDQE